MNLFKRNYPEIALPELDAALKALASFEPPVGMEARLQLAVERAGKELAAPQKFPGRFGVLAFAGRAPMRLAASVAVGFAMLGGVAVYELQGTHHAHLAVPVRSGGFGSASAVHTPTGPNTTVQPAPLKAPLTGHKSTAQPRHTASSRAHLPKRPLPAVSQP